MLKKLIYSLSLCFLLFSCEEKEDAIEEIKNGTANFTASYSVEGEEINAFEDESIIIQPGDIVVDLNEKGEATLKNLSPGDYSVSATHLVDYIEPTKFTIKSSTTTQVNYTVDLSTEQIIEIIGEEAYLELIGEPIKSTEEILEEIASYRLLAYDFLGLAFSSEHYVYNYSDLGSDILKASTNSNEGYLIDNYLINGNEYDIFQLWDRFYVPMVFTSANIESLENIEKSTFEGYNNILSEMKFIRALSYFNLVKTFNTPPLTNYLSDRTDETYYNKSPLDIYNLIIEDLKFAQNNLTNEKDLQFASTQAANALLGKVYLQMAGAPLNQTDKYALALTELKKVKNNYQLEPNYSDVFSSANRNSNSEVIFYINFKIDNEAQDNGYGNYGTDKSWFGPLGDGTRLLEEDFIAAYFEDNSKLNSPINFPLEVADSRFYQNIITYSSSGTNLLDIEEWTPNKFTTLASILSGGEAGIDFPYLRYADVLLMIAEAENAINGPSQNAYEAINLVRRRAFGNTNHDLANNLTQEEFLDAILEERRLELCYEGHRKDDLVRTGKLGERIDYINTNYGSFREFFEHNSVWPIPQREIDVSGGQLIQNPHY